METLGTLIGVAGTLLTGILLGLLGGLILGALWGIRAGMWLVEIEIRGGLDALRAKRHWREIGREGSLPTEDSSFDLEETDMISPPGEMK